MVCVIPVSLLKLLTSSQPRRVSATNCARSYQAIITDRRSTAKPWPFSFELDSDHVYDGFLILSLLEDSFSRLSTLIVPHTGLQKNRFLAAVQARNAQMRLYSQPEIRHYCTKCLRTYRGADGKGSFQSVV
jgi:hypothetical protein